MPKLHSICISPTPSTKPFAIACSHPSTWGSTQQESQTIIGPTSWKTCELGKVIIVNKATREWFTLLTMAKGGWSSCYTTHDMHHESKMAFTMKSLGCDAKSYVHYNKLNGELCWSTSTIIDMFEIPLMQLPPKSFFPTTYGLVSMPPRHVTVSHIME
jgi:hypothetical protein